MCYGHVWTEPASLIPLGQNISINCHSDKKFCRNAKLYLVLNDNRVQDKLLKVINKTTIQLQLFDYKTPFSTVLCNVECSQEDKIVCGTQFCMGSPPDRPANVTCVIHEHLDNMTCTWYPGKDTYLNTNYKLYLKSLQTDEKNMFSANNVSAIIPLSQLQKNQRFSVLVCAENELGTVYSDELHIDLNNIVIPATPLVIQNTTVYSPVFKTIIEWQKQTALNETYCEERYKETKSKTWQVREWNAGSKTEHHTEYNLEANTMYEFQVRCKLTHSKSFWSNWTESVVYVTPEAAPASALDVWRYLGPSHQNGSQEVTILIKPFLPKQSRGRILGYRVYCEKQGEIVDLCQTTEIKCKVLVPPEVTSIYVTAHNSKGSSIPANITVKQQLLNYHDFPPPTNLQIIHEEQKGVSVKWVPPKSTGKALLWYIVEWTSHHGIGWEKVPKQSTSIFIGKHISMKRNGNISVYAVYQDGTSKASSIPLLEENDQDGVADKDPKIPSADTSHRKDDGDYDVGVLWGIVFGVASISLLVLALITKKFCRKRVSIVLNSITPKWLSEDYPKLQNSSVIKSLQEERDPIIHPSTGLFSVYEDAVITEVEEIQVHKGQTSLDDKKRIREAVSEKINTADDIKFISNSDMVESNGYKPQVSHKTLLGNVFSNTYKTHSQNLDTKLNSPTLPINSLTKGCTSPLATIWPAVCTDEEIFLFEKINLVLNNSRSGQSNISSTEEEPDPLVANQWTFLLSENNIQEQTLIPDDLLSCLKATNEDPTDVMSYFPQNMAK
ncbi:interleukin-23 receptor [Pogona vitticeps]